MPVKLIPVEDQKILLQIAREAITAAVKGKPLPPFKMNNYPDLLKESGATFVTLKINNELRGCIGTLEARLPLIEDVRQHAIAAALEDYRFPPVQPEELNHIEIEISCLTDPIDLEYSDGKDLVEKLHPGKDGVILRDGLHRATFLPQVWEQLPDPEEFLSHLCHKMGASPNLWRRKKLGIQIYHVEEFHE